MNKFRFYGVLLFFVLSNTLYAGTVKPKNIDIPPSLVPELYQLSDQSAAHGAVSSSIVSPNAFGSTRNSVFIGYSNLSTASIVRGNNINSMVFGMSFGLAKKAVGVTVGIADDSLFSDQPFLHDASLSLRLNRYVTDQFAIAAGAINLVGSNRFNNFPVSYYLVLTHSMNTRVPINASFGLGTGLFNPYEKLIDNHSNILYPFASIGFGLLPHLSFITDWTSNKLSIGMAYTPRIFPQWPIAFNLSLLNVIGRLNQNEQHGSLCLQIIVWHTLI